MADPEVRPLCFVAMPFGRKLAPDGGARAIDFEHVFAALRAGIEGAGFECHRADQSPQGGFVHRPMFEELLVAECVVADVTFSNVNVAYEVGVRHGSGGAATVLVCEEGHVPHLPFDFAPLRVLPYQVDAAGRVKDPGDLAAALKGRIEGAFEDGAPPDNPIVQVTRLGSGESVAHAKADVFLRRLRYASAIGEQVVAALDLVGDAEAVERLRALEQQVTPAGKVRQLHSALLSIFLGYRERKAYAEMVRLHADLPRELQGTAVVREQLALALNRLAEEAAKHGKHDDARAQRRSALRQLDGIPEARRTSETSGIRGRIFKGLADAETDEALASAALDQAISAYEEGLRLDPRDYYPGVNAVTLRLRRNTEADRAALPRLIHVVRFAVERTPAPKDAQERYWRTATLAELAAGEGDWPGANGALSEVLLLDVPAWMRETTANNLRIIEEARAGDHAAVASLRELRARLESPRA